MTRFERMFGWGVRLVIIGCAVLLALDGLRAI